MEPILVTGAARGLGRSLVEELAGRGHEVIATNRSGQDLQGLPSGVRTLRMDVTEDRSVEQAVEQLGPLGAVVNNAGVTVSGPVEAVPTEVAAELFDTNVLGPLRVARAFAPAMRRRRQGTIVNVSSVAGRVAPPLHGVYAASKGALEQLSEALRFELGHFGVHVVVVVSGGIATGMPARQRVFASEAYAPLAEQVRARHDRYADRAAGAPPATVARRIADVLERPHPPARVAIGGPPEALIARLPRPAAGRLVAAGLSW